MRSTDWIECSVFAAALVCMVSADLPLRRSLGAQEAVEMPSYSIAMPEGKGWKKSEFPEREGVEFQREKKWLFDVKRVTAIRVWRDELGPQAWHFTQDQAADSIRLTERAIMESEGVAKGLYELEELESGVDSIGDKKLYGMLFKKKLKDTGGVLGIGGWAEEGRFLLYFPPSFPDDHAFYVFFISELYERDSFKGKPELDLIDPVVASFRLKPSERGGTSDEAGGDTTAPVPIPERAAGAASAPEVPLETLLDRAAPAQTLPAGAVQPDS